MRLLVVRREHVVTEVAAGPAQYRMRVIAVVGGVIFDEQIIALHSVVVPGAQGQRPLPGEVQLPGGQLRSLTGR